ncbi:MT-A70-domain-containing protein [Hyaloscypha hepaticicola]|uniref:MT-A70-domain-containing protein n=1 Tax=Hyaloscypha hepaticicola TaxID=2082293 RepID=A0A2J6PQ01_9HELO|nr:MT-A70-domain-containing protein [Hyaloscypha hepaticicola]
MASCILYQNPKSTVILIDIPRSIEAAQGAVSQRLLSSKPIEHPFPSVEPKSEKARANLGPVSIEELLLQKHIQLSLDLLKGEWRGEWCLPRQVKSVEAEDEGSGRKRKKTAVKDKDTNVPTPPETPKAVQTEAQEEPFFRTSTAEATFIGREQNSVRILTNSTVLCGDINVTIDIFQSHAPKFDLIILDPPWPNRSARRKKSYGILYGNHEIKALLSSLPLADHLTEDASIGIWVTNKPAFRDMVLGEGGLFEGWGVQLVEEWIWLKVTSAGEPISELGSMWRKPYEILLVGRRGAFPDSDVKRRVLVGVPDLHSRKPNLKSIFEQVMKKKEYEALEIFARNLTSGWWAWGNEVLKFQSDECWIEADH